MPPEIATESIQDLKQLYLVCFWDSLGVKEEAEANQTIRMIVAI